MVGALTERGKLYSIGTLQLRKKVCMWIKESSNGALVWKTAKSQRQMPSRAADCFLLAMLACTLPALILVAGLDLPNTPAGALARFVFACR